jgi:hypothetical protein
MPAVDILYLDNLLRPVGILALHVLCTVQKRYVHSLIHSSIHQWQVLDLLDWCTCALMGDRSVIKLQRVPGVDSWSPPSDLAARHSLGMKRAKYGDLRWESQGKKKECH